MAQVAETRALETDTKATEAADKSAFSSKEEALSLELKKLTSELKSRREENKESEDLLRKKKVKYEAEAANWIAKYDQVSRNGDFRPGRAFSGLSCRTPRSPHPALPAHQDMEEKDKEITALRTIYEEERKELNRLEDYFNRLMAEREAALAEERKKAEERARQAAQQATLNKAATMLQTIWRGKCARRELEKKKSGGGKGKKGKGGKKKK